MIKQNPVAWRWRDNEYQTWNFVSSEPVHMDYVFVEPLYANHIAFDVRPDEAWEELCNYDDRTSPPDYPDHALITREELRNFMIRFLEHQ